MSFFTDSCIVFLSEVNKFDRFIHFNCFFYFSNKLQKYKKLIFFIGGWIFFMKELFKNYEVHHKIVIFGFSMTFSLSCIMFELIIFEILGYLDTA
jgi:hypothetical protein